MSSSFNLCVVAVGYNRPDAMKRLLNSLVKADYEQDKVDLLISIDKGMRQKEIAKYANAFNWEFGNKTVRVFPEKQGLRPHILQCGDVVLDYDAVVILEDDITVSESFYSYVKQAVSFYGDNDKIGGISLYKHLINPATLSFFEPEYNGYDTYLMQFAQSWGECWTKNMWIKFRQWYNENVDTVFEDDNADILKKIPKNIRNWGDHSWMRYYMAYIVENDLYYVYPHHSLTTNHNESGQHALFTTNYYQLALATGKTEYRFPNFEQAVKYDIFFERQDVIIPGYENKKVVLDLYGKKYEYFDGEILISTMPRPYKCLEKWAFKCRPQEQNCILQGKGNGIFVYDLNVSDKSPRFNSDFLRTAYDVKSINWRKLFKYSVNCAFTGLKRKLFK